MFLSRMYLTYCSYGNLESKGVKIIWGDFSEGVGKLIPEGFTFDYVFDNYAKDVETCQDVASNAQAWYVPITFTDRTLPYATVCYFHTICQPGRDGDNDAVQMGCI